MSVLQRIAAATRERVAQQKTQIPLEELRAALPTARIPHDFRAAFAPAGPHVIAEVKLASPSQGAIAPQADPVAVATDYLAHGATALSVLTEPAFFGGALTSLSRIRAAHPDARLLQKDFFLDAYQLYQARLSGADAILLIVAMLEPDELGALFQLASELRLTALVEVHTAEEMARARALGAGLIGVNNRDLGSLQTELETSRRLRPLAPPAATLICESGLRSGADLRAARSWGYQGFLIGTSLMATGNPGPALAQLLAEAADG